LGISNSFHDSEKDKMEPILLKIYLKEISCFWIDESIKRRGCYV